MTKSSRHKKLRKQEKAKTQLTGVKKLNKAQNVVEPKLRVKKILIREQLKTSSLSASVSSALKKSDNASEISDDYEISTGKRSVQVNFKFLESENFCRLILDDRMNGNAVWIC